jgi:hypothetical protein
MSHLSPDRCALPRVPITPIPAKRRIVKKDGLVVFHGGMSPGYHKKITRELASELKKVSPNAPVVASLQESIRNSYLNAPRQTAMLRLAGANPRFFEMFDWFSTLPGSKFARDCAKARSARMFVLSDRLLETNGIKVHNSFGPQSPEELHALLQTRRQTGTICFLR